MKNEVLELINEIESLIKSRGNVDLFAEKITQLVALAPLSLASKFNKGIELYRTTNFHTSIPNRIDELWFPPKQFAKLSRANREGNPMFYCSSDPTATFLEIGIQLGQLAVHAKWITKDEMLLHDLGYTQKAFYRAGANRIVPKDNLNFELSGFTDVHEFIHLAFTEIISSKYELTSAIAEVHLRAPEFSGIRYPAVSKKANVDNLALSPEFVKNKMQLKTAQLVKVDTINNDKTDIGGIIIAELKKVNNDGSLEWEFKETGEIVSKPGESQAIKPGRYTLQSDGQIAVGNEIFDLKAGYTLEVRNDGGFIVTDLRGNKVEANKT